MFKVATALGSEGL